MTKHQEGPIFLALGVGHLGGRNSLLSALANEGFAIRRIPVD